MTIHPHGAWVASPARIPRSVYDGSRRMRRGNGGHKTTRAVFSKAPQFLFSPTQTTPLDTNKVFSVSMSDSNATTTFEEYQVENIFLEDYSRTPGGLLALKAALLQNDRFARRLVFQGDMSEAQIVESCTVLGALKVFPVLWLRDCHWTNTSLAAIGKLKGCSEVVFSGRERDIKEQGELPHFTTMVQTNSNLTKLFLKDICRPREEECIDFFKSVEKSTTLTHLAVHLIDSSQRDRWLASIIQNNHTLLFLRVLEDEFKTKELDRMRDALKNHNATLETIDLCKEFKKYHMVYIQPYLVRNQFWKRVKVLPEGNCVIVPAISRILSSCKGIESNGTDSDKSITYWLLRRNISTILENRGIKTNETQPPPTKRAKTTEP